MAPHPVIVTIRDNKGNIRVLLNSYYSTITGWGVLLKYVLMSPRKARLVLRTGTKQIDKNDRPQGSMSITNAYIGP